MKVAVVLLVGLVAFAVAACDTPSTTLYKEACRRSLLAAHTIGDSIKVLESRVNGSEGNSSCNSYVTLTPLPESPPSMVPDSVPRDSTP